MPGRVPLRRASSRAQVHHELGHLALAREHAGRALALYTSLGVHDPAGTFG
jgi:hypothetical protein